VESYSVLISLYENENPAYFHASIESILNQTVPPEQIVLVIDGPIGIELQKVVAYFRHMLDVIELEKNLGLGQALAFGLSRCTNEFVARMDTDDVAVPNRAEVQLRYLQTHPSVSVVGGNIAEFDTTIGESDMVRRIVPERNAAIRKFARRRNPMNHVSVMFRKKNIIHAGNYQSFNGFEDYHLWVRMLSLGFELANVDQILVYVRASKAMIGRRRGMNYIQSEYNFQRFMLRSRFINLMVFFENVLLRCSARLLAPKLLSEVYSKFLRSKVQR